MRTPLIITALALAFAWFCVAYGMPLVAGVALAFGLFCLCGWFMAAPTQVLGALLALVALSPPGVAFTLGATAGFFGALEAPAASTASLNSGALLEVPYNAGMELFRSPANATLI